MKHTAILNKKDYKEFTEQIDNLSSKGFNLPYTVEYLQDDKFKIEVTTDYDLDELDKISSGDV
jgi:hypothetical protein